MPRHKEITPEQEQQIKDLFKKHGKYRVVAAIVKKDPLTIKRVLGVLQDKDKVVDGYFNWNSFNKSVIV